jgi:protein disulfide-isomerase A1
MPTWDKFAKLVQEEGFNVAVVKVDCADQANLCGEHSIRAYPTIRWYKGGQAIEPDYKMDRTTDALMEYALDQIG